MKLYIISKCDNSLCCWTLSFYIDFNLYFYFINWNSFYLFPSLANTVFYSILPYLPAAFLFFISNSLIIYHSFFSLFFILSVKRLRGRIVKFAEFSSIELTVLPVKASVDGICLFRGKR
jgi:hypothetical protein